MPLTNKKTRTQVKCRLAKRLATICGHVWQRVPSKREQARQDTFMKDAELILAKIENAAVKPPQWLPEPEPKPAK